MDSPPKRTDDAGRAAQTGWWAPPRVAPLVTASAPARPSSRSAPGTQKTRPAGPPRSVGASPRSLLQRRALAPPADHRAGLVASLTVPARHSVHSLWLCLLFRSSSSPVFPYPTTFSFCLQSFLPNLPFFVPPMDELFLISKHQL